MPATALSRKELIKLLRESGLVTPRQMEQCLTQVTSHDPNLILSHLMQAGLITEYHGRELAAGRNKGFFIGKYKLLRPLAAGGMGVVLHCTHIHMQHHVALKLLPKEHNDDMSAVTRFYREARAVAAVKHPNVVQAYDVGQEGPWHCIVMEYVDGVNLHKLATKYGVLSEVRAAHYIAQAAAGLQCIMENGLVHRDLKPGNLILSRDNSIKILDLGLARFLDQRSDGLTRQLGDEKVLGTADFISPEQALHSHDVDIRADIYSLGMTFYYLLTGQLPFKVPTIAGKLMAHQTKMPKALLKRRPDVSAEMDAILTRMIQKNPDDRFTTPQELIVALKPWTDVPLPLPESEWFHSDSAHFVAHQAASSQQSKDVPLLKKTQSNPAVEPATVIQAKPQTTPMADPLAELQDVSMFSLDRGGSSFSQRATSREQQLKRLVIIGVIAMPLVTILILALWFFLIR